jgi:succinylglutamate desuccinylase
MYYRYVKGLYDVHNRMRKEFHKDILEYQRLKKWGKYLEDPSKYEADKKGMTSS